MTIEKTVINEKWWVPEEVWLGEQATNDTLRARVAELEAEHPDWMHRIRRERREAVALAVDSINVQLREHGIDMQFDATAFISK